MQPKNKFKVLIDGINGSWHNPLSKDRYCFKILEGYNEVDITTYPYYSVTTLECKLSEKDGVMYVNVKDAEYEFEVSQSPVEKIRLKINNNQYVTLERGFCKK